MIQRTEKLLDKYTLQALSEVIPGDIEEIDSFQMPDGSIHHTATYVDTSTGITHRGTWKEYQDEVVKGWGSNERTSVVTLYERVA